MTTEEVVKSLFDRADIRVGGDRPWDIQVRNQKFYNRCLTEGSVGLGESYLDAWWECPHVDQFICKLLKARIRAKIPTWSLAWSTMKARLFNLQKPSRAFHIGECHYDIGNDLYERMLGSSMMYSCAYWHDADNLDEAQERKLRMTCDKLDIKPGMAILDIGCGWGSLCQFLAEQYDVRVVGITVSKQQEALARERCRELPVEIRYQDYRDVDERFDRIISIGMFEHVGYKNYRTYMRRVAHCLKDDGLFLLHTIGNNESHVSIDPWVGKYIFPNSLIPSIQQIGAAIEELFVMEDWHNLNIHYDKTLMAWFDNFSRNWSEIKSHYDDRFYRMWRYYLLSCAGAFRAREIQVWQVLLSKPGREPPHVREV